MFFPALSRFVPCPVSWQDFYLVPLSLCPGTMKKLLSHCPKKLHCPIPWKPYIRPECTQVVFWTLTKDIKLMKIKNFTPLWDTHKRYRASAQWILTHSVLCREATLSLHIVLQCTLLSFQLLRCGAHRTVQIQKFPHPIKFQIMQFQIVSYMRFTKKFVRVCVGYKKAFYQFLLCEET